MTSDPYKPLSDEDLRKCTANGEFRADMKTLRRAYEQARRANRLAEALKPYGWAFTPGPIAEALSAYLGEGTEEKP